VTVKPESELAVTAQLSEIPLVLSVMIGVAPKAFENVQDLVKFPAVPAKLCKLPARYGAASP
jgi:hypothetical protein